MGIDEAKPASTGTIGGGGGGEFESLPSSQFLRTLQRDLCTLSAVVQRILEQGPLEAVPKAPVTVDQMRVLRYVTRNTGLRVGEIASRLGIKAPSASSALDRLEAKALVVREAGRDDQRTVCIEPTEEGRALVREVQRRVEVKLAESLGRLDGDEISSIPKLIRDLVGAIMEDEDNFADLCHHCGPGYEVSCAIHRMYGSCPYAKEQRHD